MKKDKINKQEDPPKSKSTNKFKFSLTLIAVIVITAVVLSPVINNKFVWDDAEYIVRNETLKKPLSEAIPFYFDTNYFVGNYHPLTMIGFLLEYKTANLNPALYHNTNLLIHLLNVSLAFIFAFLLSRRNIWIASTVALLFGIHPMHVESVAWISQFKDVLFGFFYLLGLVVYLIYLDRQNWHKWIFYLLCLILFVLSLLSKPAAVTFPLSLMVIDFYRERKFNIASVLEKIPFFVGSVLLGLITIKAQGSAVGNFEDYTLLERIMLSSYALFSYLINLFFPIHLSALHPFPFRTDGNFPWIYRIAPLGLIPLFYLLYRSSAIGRITLFGFLFFFFNIALVLQFVTVGNALYSERYTYIPYLGLYFSIAIIIDQLIKKYGSFQWVKPLVTACAVFILIAFSGISYSRTKVWKTDKSLWTDVSKKYPLCAIAHYNLGTYFFKEEKNDPLALISYNNTISVDTTQIKAYVNRGIIFTRMREMEKAESDFAHAIRLDSNFAETYKNLGILHSTLGKYEKSISDYTNYLRILPVSPDIYYGRGMTYYQLKRFTEATEDFSKAISFDSLNANYWVLKAMALHADGKKEEAIPIALKAQELGEVLDPSFKSNLGLK
jgi:tetratricopeptide (TPR) repeat protein